jgi:hypothetical protein
MLLGMESLSGIISIRILLFGFFMDAKNNSLVIQRENGRAGTDGSLASDKRCTLFPVNDTGPGISLPGGDPGEIQEVAQTLYTK